MNFGIRYIFKGKKYHQNIQLILKQNKIQQDQIFELVHFLNLAMVQVTEH